MLRWPVILILPALLVGFLVASPARGVINPSLQPSHLADRYLNVLSCRVVAVDKSALTAALEVEGVSKGDFPTKEISLTAANKGLSEAIQCLQRGQTLVACAGKNRRRHESDKPFVAWRCTT